MRSKLFAILLVMCLLFTVVACTNPDNEKKESDIFDFGTDPTDEDPTDPTNEDPTDPGEENTQPDGGNQGEGDIQVGVKDTGTGFSPPHSVPPR